MDSFVKNTEAGHDYCGNFRIFHGGEFVTKKFKTVYIRKEGSVGILLKRDLKEVCYFNLVDIMKSELKIEDGELWFIRHGYSLFAGKKKLCDDKDIRALMESKDNEEFINLYVVESKKDSSSTTINNTPSLSNQGRTTSSNEIVNTPYSNPTTTSTATSNISLTSQHKYSKIPFRRPCSRNPQITTASPTDVLDEGTGEGIKDREYRGLEEEEEAQSGGEEELNEDDDSEDSDVVLSEGDFDDEDDDDIFYTCVDEDVPDNVIERVINGNEIVPATLNEAIVNDQVENDDIEIDCEDELLSDEDELRSNHGSDEEGSHIVEYPVFNPDTDFQKPVVLQLGLKFPNKEVLRKALRYHAIQHGYDYYFLHNGSKRISVQCRHRCDCPWLTGQGKFGACKCNSKRKCRYKLNATKNENEETFQIMGLRLKHRCGWSDFNSKLSSEYLAERYLDEWRIDNEWKLEVFQRKVMCDIGVEVGYYKAYYARARALKMIHGEASEEYKGVWNYAATVKKYNVGSSVFVKLGNIERPPPVFQRMYMCLKACADGFIAGCRPIIGIDGCHLKGAHPGQLLTAVGKDGNCNIFPVAWAVVEVENTETWTWFLELLVNDLQPIANKLTFMSDRQKGLIEALNRVVPNCEVRFSARHIWTNFKAKYPGQAFKQCFWRIARAYTKAEYEQHMEEMKMMSVDGHAYLSSIPCEHWCRHAFSINCKSGMLLNNCCESFNNALRKCRDKPIISLMEWIRRYNMKRIFSKREGVEKYDDDLMPSTVKQLEIASKISRGLKILQTDLLLFEVEHHEERFVVNLETKTCDCKKWELTGIPCAHAYGCIEKKRQDPRNFVHQAFTKETYKKAYTGNIFPLPGPKQWEKTPHLEPAPPPFRKMPGRPSLKKRRKEVGENEERQLVKKRNTQKKCSNCGRLGHNKKGCKNPTVVQTKKRKRQIRNVSTPNQEELQLTQNHPLSTQDVDATTTTTTNVVDAANTMP